MYICQYEKITNKTNNTNIPQQITKESQCKGTVTVFVIISFFHTPVSFSSCISATVKGYHYQSCKTISIPLVQSHIFIASGKTHGKLKTKIKKMAEID